MMLTWIDIVIIVLFGALSCWFFLFSSKKEGKDEEMFGNTSLLQLSRSKSSKTSRPQTPKRLRCVIYYATQSGAANEFARQLLRDLKEYEVQAHILNLADFEEEGFMNVSKDVASVFIVATYGDGEPPDSVQPFYNWAEEDVNGPKLLKDLNYCVFGLGNSTYQKFNQFAKDLDYTLQSTGARQLCPLRLGDDDKSLEEDFLEWKELIIHTLCSFVGKRAVKSTKRTQIFSVTETTHDPVEIAEKHPHAASAGSLISHPTLGNHGQAYVSRLLERKSLHKSGERTLLRCELSITDAISYSAGDHVALLPSNRDDLVERLSRRLGIEGQLDKVFEISPLNYENDQESSPFPSPCSYRMAFKHYLDITHPPQHNIIAAMAGFAKDEQQRIALTDMVHEKAQFEARIKGPRCNLAEVLEQFDSVEMPVGYLIELLPRLQWRYYSISSSPEQSPDRIAVTFSVLKYQTVPGLPERQGVATCWLETLPLFGTVPIFVRESNFQLPEDHNVPVVMIGPGTGIAPFMGFLEKRRWLRSEGKTLGEAILFFGCRRRGEDFIYSQELDEFKQLGCLTELFVAFSRDQPHKIYVQDIMLEKKQLLGQLIERNAVFYVCGDARNMARDVHQALVKIVQDFNGIDEDRAAEVVTSLKKSGRYLEDVWS